MFGAKLREIRQKLKLTKEEIATATKITYRAYISYESGDRKPSFEFLEKLATLYNVNLNWLIANKGEPFEASGTIEFSDLNAFKVDIIKSVKALLKEKGL